MMDVFMVGLFMFLVSIVRVYSLALRFAGESTIAGKGMLIANKYGLKAGICPLGRFRMIQGLKFFYFEFKVKSFTYYLLSSS
jgi:hypothetical protein